MVNKTKLRKDALEETLEGYAYGLETQVEYLGPKPAGYWKIWDNMEAEIKKAIKINKGEFPSQNFLREHGHHSLNAAIMKYYGGYRKVREKIEKRWDMK